MSAEDVQSPADRQRLVDEFRQRLRLYEADPDPPGVLRYGESVAIIVHPMADQDDVLHSFNMHPAECVGVDAYWHYRESVYWVQVNGSAIDDWEPGVYYRYVTVHTMDSFRVVIQEPAITTTAFRRVLDLLGPLIDSNTLQRVRGSAVDRTLKLAGLPDSWHAVPTQQRES